MFFDYFRIDLSRFNEDQTSRPSRLPPPMKDENIRRAKRRKQKRKTGGPR